MASKNPPIQQLNNPQANDCVCQNCQMHLAEDTDLVECLEDVIRCHWVMPFGDKQLCMHPSAKQVAKSNSRNEKVAHLLKQTPDKMECGLTDWCELVRVSFAERDDYTPTPAQIERGLTDERDAVRWTFATRKDYIPTPEQVERGLTDRDSSVRIVFAGRKDYSPTPTQVERGLTDKDERVRREFAMRTDYIATPAQIERGLTDKNDFVRVAFAGRRDYTPTLAQIERALANENDSFGIYFAWHLQNVEIAPDIKSKVGIFAWHSQELEIAPDVKGEVDMAFERRLSGLDRRQQHYAAYANCARISSRRTKSARCPSLDNLDLRLFGSMDAR